MINIKNSGYLFRIIWVWPVWLFCGIINLRGKREAHIPGQNIRYQKQLLEMSESSLTQTLLFCNSKFLLSSNAIILNLNLVFFHESKDLANLACNQVSMIIAIVPYLFSLEHQLNFKVGLACCRFFAKSNFSRSFWKKY